MKAGDKRQGLAKLIQSKLARQARVLFAYRPTIVVESSAVSPLVLGNFDFFHVRQCLQCCLELLGAGVPRHLATHVPGETQSSPTSMTGRAASTSLRGYRDTSKARLFDSKPGRSSDLFRPWLIIMKIVLILPCSRRTALFLVLIATLFTPTAKLNGCHSLYYSHPSMVLRSVTIIAPGNRGDLFTKQLKGPFTPNPPRPYIVATTTSSS